MHVGVYMKKERGRGRKSNLVPQSHRIAAFTLAAHPKMIHGHGRTTFRDNSAQL